jgi:nucleoid DNA-binding protein
MAVKKVKKVVKKVAKAAVKKAAPKAAAKKKVAVKKTATKAVKSVKPAKETAAINIKKMSAVSKPFSKSQVATELCDQAGISKKQAGAVMEVLRNIMVAHVRPGACGVYKAPGMFKVVVTQKPARKARKGISPFTGEEITFKAKPAYKAIKIRPLKQLKEVVNK